MSPQYLSDMCLDLLQNNDCQLLYLCRQEETGEETDEPSREATGQCDISFPLSKSKSKNDHEENGCPGVQPASMLASLESSNHING